VYPDVVRDDLLGGLAATNFGPADLAEWRKGGEHALRKTPHGYLGDPAAASRARGAALVQREAELVAAAVKGALLAQKR
jgi:creatinine amidohydrolase